MRISRWLLATVIIALGGCASGPHIDRSFSAVSQDNRVQFLIIHYTALDYQDSLNTLTKGRVSSHYLVRDSPPTIFQLVDDSRRAFHAGISSWKGNTQLNSASIGIEIVNLGYRDTSEGRVWFDFPKEQIDAVIELVKKIMADYDIKPERVLAHSDIAPQRKPDPGPRFPWKRLADEGLVPWPDAAMVEIKRVGYEQQLPDAEWLQRALAQHGYAVPLNGTLDTETRNVVRAFQMKYRPERIDGEPDAETAAILDVLTAR